MKNLKFGILVFGLLGVIAFFIPAGGFKLFDLREVDAKMVYGPLAGFALAAVMGIMGVAKPPFKKMHAGLALAGFALVAVLFKIWQIADWFKGPINTKLLAIAVLGGLICSILAVVKSEEA